MTIVIAGFPGVGKTCLFELKESHGINILDSDSSKFSWSEPGVRNPDFPNNYIQHIKENMGKVDIILVSTHEVVLDALYENGVDAIVVHPHASLRDEYIERYKKRGNNEQFIEFIGSNWSIFIAKLINDDRFTTISLRKSQYLSDVVIPFISKRVCLY